MVGDDARALELAGNGFGAGAAGNDDLRVGRERARRLDRLAEPDVDRARPRGREGGSEDERDEKPFQGRISPAA